MPGQGNYGILDPRVGQGLGYAAKAYMFGLVHAGMDPQTATQLALAFQQANGLQKASRGVALVKSEFHKEYAESARKLLPDYQHQHLVRQARSTVGGRASGATRRRKKGLKMIARQGMSPESARLNGGGLIVPGVGTSSGPAAAVKSAVRKRCVQALVKSATDGQMLAEPTQDEVRVRQLIDAQRLVTGMDVEMQAGADDPAVARDRACRALQSQLTHYDKAYAPQDAPGGRLGLRLDVGSGDEREPGYLGLDDEAHDYGTIVWEPSASLPVPAMSAQAVRFNRSLGGMGLPPEAMVAAAQEALAHGGTLQVVGNVPLSERVDMEEFPGLQAVSSLKGDNGYTDTYLRAPARLPGVYGAAPDHLAVHEAQHDDIAASRTRMGMGSRPERLMANLLGQAGKLQKSQSIVLKSEPWQRFVLSVVYAPGELDTDNEYMDPADIEWAAHQCMKNGAYIGSEHGGMPTGAHIVESYIAPAELSIDGPYGTQHVPKGSWLMGIKFDDEDEWQKVLKGDYRGFSLGGFALRGVEEAV